MLTQQQGTWKSCEYQILTITKLCHWWFQSCPLYKHIPSSNYWPTILLDSIGDQLVFAWRLVSNWRIFVTSVQDGIYPLRKALMRSTPSLRSFPNIAFETVLMFVWLTMAFSRRFKLALPLSTSLSLSLPLFQAIDGVVCLALCPQVASRASQHFRSFKKQATCESCFARQYFHHAFINYSFCSFCSMT